MQKMAILIMSDGTNTIDIIGTVNCVTMLEGAIRFPVNGWDEMWKKIKTAYNMLSKQGFVEITRQIKQYA